MRVHRAFFVMMLVSGAWAGVADAVEPAVPDVTPWPAPASPILDSTLASSAVNGGPAADAVEAIPTPSAMNLGAGGLALLAAARVARRIRLAA